MADFGHVAGAHGDEGAKGGRLFQSCGFPIGERVIGRGVSARDLRSEKANYDIGAIGILVFWFGLGKLLPHSEDLIPLVAAYVRYALVGFWISAGAPLVFRPVERRAQL